MLEKINNLQKAILVFTKKYSWVFILIFFLWLGFMRLSLTTKGHLFLFDEGNYRSIPTRVITEYETTKDWQKAIRMMKHCEARPVYTVISIGSLLTQKYLINKNASRHPFFLNIRIDSISQAIVTMLTSWLLFLIMKHLLNSVGFAFLTTVIYSLLASSNIYIRHMVPYDYALCFFMFNLYIFVRDFTKNQLSPRTVALNGLVSVIMFLTYPGYYWTTALNGLLLVVYSKKKIKAAIVFALVFLGVLGIVQILSKTIGTDYFFLCRHFSKTFIGSYDEAFIFIFLFLAQVEGVIGWILSGLLFLPILMSVKSKNFPLRALWLITLGGYLFHSVMAYFAHYVVFNGRVLHVYFPLIVSGVMVSVYYVRPRFLRQVLLIILCLGSLWSFWQYFPKYQALEYPTDIVNKINIINRANVFCVNDRWEDYGVSRPKSCSLEKANVIFVNLNTPYPVPSPFMAFVPPAKMVLIKETPHPWIFPGYYFEGFPKPQRQFLRTQPFMMRIYAVPELKPLEKILGKLPNLL